MMTNNKPPVNCDICENCICFCKKEAEEIWRIEDMETIGITILKIRERENYLRRLRQNLEEKQRTVYLQKQFEISSDNK